MPRPRVENLPARPVLVYDGTCELCRAWVRRWQVVDGRNHECLPAQSASVQDRFPELSPQALANSVHLIHTDGAVSSGAEAIIKALSLGRTRYWPWHIYRRSPRFARIAEWVYRRVARHRRLRSRLTASGARAF
jgi:predicted DCC family thiol-disulfide oxidoreductase YuxK